MNRTFSFNSIFDADSIQADIFKKISPLITSFLDGYNVCIFAYGQTGSGKTYTMEGESSNPGINYRVCQLLFERIAENSNEYKIQVYMVEIYNETIKDLLADENIDIRQQNETVFLSSVSKSVVKSYADVCAIFQQGYSMRKTAATVSNDISSRSHCLVFIELETDTIHSELVLIDLAGSERVSKTEATGERLKEAQNINRSVK